MRRKGGDVVQVVCAKERKEMKGEEEDAEVAPGVGESKGRGGGWGDH